MQLFKRIRIATVFLVALLFVGTVSAQVRPSMTLTVTWTPDEQLTTRDEDNPADGIQADEERYVDAQFVLYGNVQFWAMDFSCQIGTGAQLELVVVTLPDNVWGTDYFIFDGDQTDTDPTDDIYSRYNSSGRLAFTVTRVGASTTPVGSNGVDYSLTVVNARFKVKNLAVDTSVPVSGCTATQFLSRDGKRITATRQGVFTQLFVRVGYVLRGIATRQGAVNKLNIRVTCTHLASSPPEGIYTAYTTTAGTYTFGGGTANPLRNYGLYECVFESDLDHNGTPDSQFLQSRAFINLTTPFYQLMPVTIRPGDFDASNTIALADLDAITGSYNQLVGLFGQGDANGDAYARNNDLALVASNINLSDASNPLSAEHVLYSLGTDYDPRQVFPNSRVQVGTPESGEIIPFSPRSRTRDFWGTLSPDGAEVAYVSVNARSGAHELFIASTSNGVGRPFRLPRGFKYSDILAPSWSPDGNMLAFVCTVNQVDAGLQYNEGDLCLVNRGDSRGDSVRALGVDTEIFPPAWFSYPSGTGTGYALIYSENNTIKYYDLSSGASGTIPDLPSGADMPVVVNHYSGDSYLFYRYDSGSATDLRVALLEAGNTYTVASSGPSFSGFGAAGDTSGTTSPTHMIITNSDGVAYYDVSPLLDIMFYDDTEYDIQNLLLADSTPAIEGPGSTADNWDVGTVHYVDGNIGSPTWQSGPGGGPGVPWSGNENVPTELHAHRVTFDWVP